MDFDKEIIDGKITIYCDNNLYEFSKDFLEYYKKDVVRIKNELGLTDDYDIIFALVNDRDRLGARPYKDMETSISGFFTDTGVAAFVEENGTYSKDMLFRKLMHETTHYLYRSYVYGADKERITWVDEGLAQFFSNEKDGLNDEDKFREYIKDNIKDVDLNTLVHEDESFGRQNGYPLSYIAIRYLYENTTHEEFLDTIKDTNKLKNLGTSILSEVINSYLGDDNKGEKASEK